MFVVIGVVGVAVLAANLLLGDLVPGVGDAVPSDLLSTEAIGAFVAWAAGRLTRVVHGGSSGATTSTVDTVGCHGRVVSAIPVGGRGVVSVVVGGRAVRLDAVADGPLPAGAAVRVTGVLSPTAVTVRAAATGRP
jgi:hypothetical protein